MSPVTDAATDAATTPDPVAEPVEQNLLGGAAAALVFGFGLAYSGHLSALALLVAVAVTQAAVAFAWVLGTSMPGRRGGILLAALAAGGADATASVWPHGRLGVLLAVLGLAVPVMFVHQLSRGAARVQLVSSLSAVAVLVLAEVSLAALLQLRHEFPDPELGGRVVATVVGAAAAALVVGALLDTVVAAPRFDPEVPRGLLGLVGSAAVGGCVGYLILQDETDFADGRGVFLGAAAGALAGLLAVAAAFVQHTTPAPGSAVARMLRPVFAALLPLCILAPAGFLLCLAIRV